MVLRSEEDDNDENNSESEALWVNSNSDKDLHKNKEKQAWFLVPAAVTVASLGGILFGYDIGIISGAILVLRKEFQLHCFQQEMIVTFLIIGGLISSLTGGLLLDHIGRKITIILNAFLFLIGAVILSFSNSFSIFLVGRLIVGFAVALSAVGDCVYISEIAPPRKRGLLVSLNELGITLGILLAYLTNYLLINYEGGWRYMFGLSAIPAFLQAIGMLFLPYSPRWLVTKGRDEKALDVISTLWPHLNARVELARMKTSLSREQNYRMLDLLSKKDNMRMRMMIGCGTIFFQQLTGQPTVLYYAPVLFKTLGFNKNTSATLATMGLGIVKVIFTLGTLLAVDKLGRRKFLLIGATIMTMSLVTLTAVTEPFHSQKNTPACHDVVGGRILNVHLINTHKNTTNCTIANSVKKIETSNQTMDHIYNNISKRHNMNNDRLNRSHCDDTSSDKRQIEETQEKSKSVPQAVKYTCLLALMMFVIGYAVGYGPMSWLILTEIFPTAIKGRAASVATSVNWGTNIIISMTFLDVIGSLGPFFTFLMYSLIGAASIIFLFHFVPETKGKSLEDISEQLNKRSLRCATIHWCEKGEIVHMETDENDILLSEEQYPIHDGDEVEDVM